jgi:hypothetical protein
MVTHEVSSDQQFFLQKLTKVGERTVQGSRRGNRTQQPAAAHNRNKDIAQHKQSPQNSVVVL